MASLNYDMYGGTSCATGSSAYSTNSSDCPMQYIETYYEPIKYASLGNNSYKYMWSGRSTTSIVDSYFSWVQKKVGSLIYETCKWDGEDSTWGYCGPCDTDNEYGWYSWGNTSATSDAWVLSQPAPKSPSDLLREMIQARQVPMVFTPTRRPLAAQAPTRELRARATLRRVIGDEKYRRFIKHGFVAVQAASGKVYQLFPGHEMTKVYVNGKLTEKLCVVLSGDFPPTDSLIMRYLMVLNDEDDFRSRANRWGASNTPLTAPGQPDQRPLVDIFNDLKRGVRINPRPSQRKVQKAA